MSITSIAFLTSFGAALLAALFRHPRYGLYAYMATFYLHPIDRWWGRDLPDLRWSLIAGAVALVATLRLPAQENRADWSAQTSTRLLLALTLWIWVQSLWALSTTYHLELATLFTKYVVLTYLIYRLVDDETSIRHFLTAHVIGCVYLGILILEAPAGGRLEGVGGPGIDEANALAMHLGTGAIAAAALLVRGSLLQRTLGLFAIALIANGVVQTESRSAFLGLAAGGLAMLWLSPTRYRRLWILCGIAGLALLFRVAPQNFWERMATITATTSTETEVDQSADTRKVLLKAQWQMFLAYPLGSGHRGTALLSARYLDEKHLSRTSRELESGTQARSSHNTFMTLLVEQGLPGAVLYLGLLSWILRSWAAARFSLRESGREEQALYLMAVGGMLATILVAGLFVDYLKAEVFIWALGLLSVVQASTRTVMSQSSGLTPGAAARPRGADALPPGASLKGESARSP